MSPGLACQGQGWDWQPSSSMSIPMHVAWAINRRCWKPLYSRTATTWSPSQKRGGTTRMTGMLSWMATDSLGKTDQQGEVVELLYMWGSNWNALNFAWGRMKKELRAYELELRGSLIWVMLLWVCTTGHLTRRRKSMRPSTSICKQPHSHRPWFSWGTSTTLTSAGKTTQLGIRNPGGSCRASMVTFWCKW